MGAAKFVPTAILGVSGFYVLDLIPLYCRLNSQYFMEHVRMPVVQTGFP
jgi:hypothetical protein